MKKIIHFHPNGNYSKKFINPLSICEKKLGFKSVIVNDIMVSNKNLQIDYIFKKNNFFKFPLNFILLILHIYRLKPDIIFCHNSFFYFNSFNIFTIVDIICNSLSTANES